ncbi:MAG: MGH1-like glycoside hydrolase domain-containing protein [Actinomycetota bacterium]
MVSPWGDLAGSWLLAYRRRRFSGDLGIRLVQTPAVNELANNDAEVTTAEHRRLADPAWKAWGPYLSERAWGTVREDYSENGTAWSYLPHDHARSRAYRWNEDGLGGICDANQRICLAFAFWNGRDPILKERIFGLTSTEGNHGEDPKEYWWYLDSTPTHSWMVWRYLYPHAEYPYARLVEENGRRDRLDPEFELIDTGLLDQDRFFEITVEYAKAAADDYRIRVLLRNPGPEPATIHVLPTIWFRNTWSWEPGEPRPALWTENGSILAKHRDIDRLVLEGTGQPELLFSDNESNAERLWGGKGPLYPKDGIGDHVVEGKPSVNPARTGTKAALWYRRTILAGGIEEIRLRLGPVGVPVGEGFDDVFRLRRAEADEFYASLTPTDATQDESEVMRQAFAGMLWSKQFYHYDVERWLEGDSNFPPPPAKRSNGRNATWHHLNNADVLSMPDKWEYPWYATWDLAFHCVALAHVDPQLAKEQLILLCREWYMHPNGQLPAYEWAFGDVHPPVHAWAALRVFEIDGGRDHEFLERLIHKLLLNFTWWVNRKDTSGNNVFEGGFLGMDNIGPFDRSAGLAPGMLLEQADGTAWMAMYCLNLLEMALRLADHDPTYEDVATKFFEHFAYVASAIHTQGLWSEEDGFYYDVLQTDGHRVPLRVRSMVGLIPLYATTTIAKATIERLPDFARRFRWFLKFKPQYGDVVSHVNRLGMYEGRLLSILSPDRLRRVLQVMLDPNEFLSPYGIRSVSAYHRDNPFQINLRGMQASVDYQPGESTVGLFGGNSNWRGPVWFPVNYLVIESLHRFDRYFGDEFRVECPAGSGVLMTLSEVADELARRLTAIFLFDGQGRRPVFGTNEWFQTHPRVSQCVPFYEYFHGDTGMGLGASHQTGWTGLVADLIASRRNVVA